MKAQKFLKVYHCNLFQYLVVVLVCSYSRPKVSNLYLSAFYHNNGFIISVTFISVSTKIYQNLVQSQL